MTTKPHERRVALHTIEPVAHRGTEQRLGSLLLRLTRSPGRKGCIGRKDGVIVPISHNELAQLAGMSGPHVTVTMGRLRRRGLVQSEPQRWYRRGSLADYFGRIGHANGRRRY
jgi:CRP-like cAMP-binding protein